MSIDARDAGAGGSPAAGTWGVAVGAGIPLIDAELSCGGDGVAGAAGGGALGIAADGAGADGRGALGASVGRIGVALAGRVGGDGRAGVAPPTCPGCPGRTGGTGRMGGIVGRNPNAIARAGVGCCAPPAIGGVNDGRGGNIPGFAGTAALGSAGVGVDGAIGIGGVAIAGRIGVGAAAITGRIGVAGVRVAGRIGIAGVALAGGVDGVGVGGRTTAGAVSVSASAKAACAITGPAAANAGANSSSIELTPIVMTPPQTEQRARMPMSDTLSGSTRKTDRHSGQRTFTPPPSRSQLRTGRR